MLRSIGVDERRARLARRHHLATADRAGGVAEVAADLVGLHATDPASVFIAAAARLRSPHVEAIEAALYEDRALVRMLGMRRTMFVLPVELAPVVQAACTRSIAARERRRLVQRLEGAGFTEDAAAWLREVEDATMRALAARGEATGAELTREVEHLQTKLLLSEGKRYESLSNLTTFVLTLLAADGRIVRGRPRGSWISSQYRWAPSWLEPGEWTVDDAQADLVRRWLASFGPGTRADLRWWTGLSAREVDRSLARVGAVEVALGEAVGLVLADDLDGVVAPDPWAAFLPALDPTVMGWSGRSWFLGEHGPALFDRSGNAGPTVWWEGRVVGGWGQRKDGEIAYRLLEDVGAEALLAVEVEAHRLAAWLRGVRVSPRFRTPLELSLQEGG